MLRGTVIDLAIAAIFVGGFYVYFKYFDEDHEDCSPGHCKQCYPPPMTFRQAKRKIKRMRRYALRQMRQAEWGYLNKLKEALLAIIVLVFGLKIVLLMIDPYLPILFGALVVVVVFMVAKNRTWR